MLSTDGGMIGTRMSAPKCIWVIRKPKQASQYHSCSQHLHSLLHLHKTALYHCMREEAEVKVWAQCHRWWQGKQGITAQVPWMLQLLLLPRTSSGDLGHRCNLIASQCEPF